MSLKEELTRALEAEDAPFIEIRIFKDVQHHGEKAIQVRVDLELPPAQRGAHHRRVMVEGIFTTAEKAAFGGVLFAQQKDIPALMASKIRAVLAGTAEEVRA